MKMMYLDCGMGAAGDMLTAALLDLLPDPEAYVCELNKLGVPGVQYMWSRSVKCGIEGGHISVLVHGEEEQSLDVKEPDHGCEHAHHHVQDCEHTHEHACNHRSMGDVREIVESLQISENVKQDVLAVYELIARAESTVHGESVEQIHFHEVGNMDAIADITAVCWLMDRIAPDRIIVSTIHTGFGKVRCAHGILPVPAPATALLLQDMPICAGSVEGELCTPTGAALLKYYAHAFGTMPPMIQGKTGYGMGNKDFAAANCIRAFLGENTEDTADGVSELSCNVDDMTAEEIAFACERLMEEGALDVYTLPVGMKKGRPGMLLRVLCKTEEKEKTLQCLFRYTSTIGIRETICSRYVLDRRMGKVETEYGPIRYKESTGYGVSRRKYEYEDLAALARKTGKSLGEIKELIE